MFQKEFPKESFIPAPSVKEGELSLVVPVDQYDSKSFNRNDAGWPRNDIAQIARAQSIDEYNAIVARLAERRKDGGLPDGITDREAFDSIKPRFVQSACEVEQFVEFTNDSVMRKVDEAYRKALGLKDDSKKAEKPSSSGDIDSKES